MIVATRDTAGATVGDVGFAGYVWVVWVGVRHLAAFGTWSRSGVAAIWRRKMEKEKTSGRTGGLAPPIIIVHPLT